MVGGPRLGRGRKRHTKARAKFLLQAFSWYQQHFKQICRHIQRQGPCKGQRVVSETVLKSRSWILDGGILQRDRLEVKGAEQRAC